MTAALSEGITNGLAILSIADPLNDCDNLRDPISIFKSLGGSVDAWIMLADDPVDEKVNTETSSKNRRSLISRLFGGHQEPIAPHSLYSDKYFIEKGKELERLGADSLTLADPNGLINPERAENLRTSLEMETKLPVTLKIGNMSRIKKSKFENLSKEISKIRIDSGLVPFTPILDEIIIRQAENLVKDKENGNEQYTTKDPAYIALIRGEYGTTPVPVDPMFRNLITGSLIEYPLS